MPWGSLKEKLKERPIFGSPNLEKSKRNKELMSVMVPSVEREFPPSLFWSTTMAVDKLEIESTSGRPYFGRKVRTKLLKVSFNSLPASCAIVSKTIDDFPEPETPVKTVSFLLGIFRLTFFRLFSLAPRISMNSVSISVPPS